MLVAAWVARVRLVALAFAVLLELVVEMQQHRCLKGAKRAGCDMGESPTEVRKNGVGMIHGPRNRTTEQDQGTGP